jgi:chromate transporter
MENIEKHENKRRILWSLFVSFFNMALFTVGGGYAMLPVMEDEFVRKKKWVKAEDIVDVMAVIQSVPGVIALNAAVFVGTRVAGFAGGLVSGLGVVTPSFIVILLIAMFMRNIGQLELVDNAFIGIRSGVCALIFLAAINLGRKIVNDKVELCIALAAFFAIMFFKVNVLLIIVIGGLAGMIRYYLNMRKMALSSDAARKREGKQ